MDEPFSAVDALTRAGLQELLRSLWRELNLTVIFVTHDVDEGVYLSSRVVALTRAPGTIAIDMPVDLPAQRDQIATRALPAYLDYRARLLAQLFADEGLKTTEAA
jgi:NitT/TauT family transport system ATP-binding protein